MLSLRTLITFFYSKPEFGGQLSKIPMFVVHISSSHKIPFIQAEATQSDGGSQDPGQWQAGGQTPAIPLSTHPPDRGPGIVEAAQTPGTECMEEVSHARKHGYKPPCCMSFLWHLGLPRQCSVIAVTTADFVNEHSSRHKGRVAQKISRGKIRSTKGKTVSGTYWQTYGQPC